jgi:hypothetical protein
MTSNPRDWNRRHEFYSSFTGFGALTISKTMQGELTGTAARLAITGTASRLTITGTTATHRGFAGTASRLTATGTNATQGGFAGTAARLAATGTNATQGGFAGTAARLAATGTSTRFNDTRTARRGRLSRSNARLNNARTTAGWDGFAGTSQAMVITPMTTTPMIVKIALIDVRRIPGTTTPDMVAVTISPITRYSFIPGWGITIIRPSVIMVFGTIPTTAPGSPPPTTLEKQFYRNVRNRIYIGSGQNNHIR